MKPEPAMSVHDVAAYLSVDEKTIYRLVQRGELPGFKVLHRASSARISGAGSNTASAVLQACNNKTASEGRGECGLVSYHPVRQTARCSFSRPAPWN